jgi:hypothetical protein
MKAQGGGAFGGLETYPRAAARASISLISLVGVGASRRMVSAGERSPTSTTLALAFVAMQ